MFIGNQQCPPFPRKEGAPSASDQPNQRQLDRLFLAIESSEEQPFQQSIGPLPPIQKHAWDNSRPYATGLLTLPKKLQQFPFLIGCPREQLRIEFAGYENPLTF